MPQPSKAKPREENLASVARSKTTWVFDMDGVLYRGKEVVPGAPEAIALLKQAGKRVAFLTNNSTRTREAYVDLLRGMGIQASMEDVFTSASITASWLETRVRNQGIEPGSLNVYVIGEDGIKAGLRQHGFTVVTERDFDSDTAMHGKVQYVVVGLDRQLTYHKLDIALNCIIKGAAFLATNDDAALPMEGGTLAPGAGAIVQALVTCSKHEPDFGSPFGKPNPMALHEIARVYGENLDFVISVGDRLETDILASKKAGITSILVLSGITQEGDGIPASMQPDFILPSIARLSILLGK
jgi:phosphoglycolate/pyridoxal phosphate phosphatase family enzyme